MDTTINRPERRWIYDDGGRAAAGYRGHAGDCVCRAIAIASCQDYQTVYNELNERSRDSIGRRGRRSSSRNGVHHSVYRQYLTDYGWIWRPCMTIGSGCRVHLRASEMPSGRIIARLSRHLVAVVDGTIHDTYDPSREGTRCVYGFWCRS
jgi:hypothetical protein